MAGNAGIAPGSAHKESRIATFNGFAGLALGLVLIALAGYVIYGGIVAATTERAVGQIGRQSRRRAQGDDGRQPDDVLCAESEVQPVINTGTLYT